MAPVTLICKGHTVPGISLLWEQKAISDIITEAHLYIFQIKRIFLGVENLH
jgi:hypothetical protein